MTTTLAVAGKGGTGKTTVAALLIRYLVQHNMGSVLAIDADPSSNLNLALGVPLDQTIGAVREEALTKVQAGNMGSGMTKTDFLEYGVRDALVEEKGFDLLAMGRPEGPGCYCAANSILRNSMDRLSQGYDYVVMDNEAGMEHLSRKTTEDVDTLLLVSNHTVKGVRAIARIRELVTILKLSVKKQLVIINNVSGSLDSLVEKELTQLGLKADAIIPQDELLYRFDLEQKPLVLMPDNSPAVQAVNLVMKNIFN